MELSSAVSGDEELLAKIRLMRLDRLVSTYLQTRDVEWDLRDASLQRLTELLQEGALDTQSADFAQQLKSVVTAIVTQLPDLRSQVAKSACSSLTTLATHLGDHGGLDRPMRESVLPTLLTMAGNGNKVLAAAARDCLPQLLVSCHFEGMLKVRGRRRPRDRTGAGPGPGLRGGSGRRAKAKVHAAGGWDQPAGRAPRRRPTRSLPRRSRSPSSLQSASCAACASSTRCSTGPWRGSPGKARCSREC